MTFFDYIWLDRFFFNLSFLPQLYFIRSCRTWGKAPKFVNESHTIDKHPFSPLSKKHALCAYWYGKESHHERGERSGGSWKGEGRKNFLQLRKEIRETHLERNKNWRLRKERKTCGKVETNKSSNFLLYTSNVHKDTKMYITDNLASLIYVSFKTRKGVAEKNTCLIVFLLRIQQNTLKPENMNSITISLRPFTQNP